MATLSISLPDQMKEFVEEQVQKGGFGSASDYVRSIIHDIQICQAKRSLEAKLREGLESGPAALMTKEDWDAIEREGIERARAGVKNHGP